MTFYHLKIIQTICESPWAYENGYKNKVYIAHFNGSKSLVGF